MERLGATTWVEPEDPLRRCRQPTLCNYWHTGCYGSCFKACYLLRVML